MLYIEKMKDKILNGNQITQSQAFSLYKQPLKELCEAADEIRKHFCSNQFDICTIINAKSGGCTENCKFCAQSIQNDTKTKVYPLLSDEKIIKHAKLNHEQGILRYSIVTSGRCLSDNEIIKICETVKEIRKQLDISVCISCGLLNREQFKKLKDSGITRVHNNLETSQRNFPNICTSHTFDDKITAIKAAQSVGLQVCSGGIMGLGETPKDRIDMAFTLRDLGIKSIPINMLNPIKGTPFEENRKLTDKEMRRIVAVYRFILPTAFIRLAGGRGLLADKGTSCFLSGANAAISGDMLTTSGITVENDIEHLNALGYEVKLCNE